MQVVEADGIKLFTDDPIMIAVMQRLKRVAGERDSQRRTNIGDLRTLRRDVRRLLVNTDKPNS
jgi:hypothetical protein